MYCQGMGKAAHGLRISVVIDEESRYLLGYAVGHYRQVATIEKKAIEAANKVLVQKGLPEIESCGKSKKISAFFGNLNCECLFSRDYKNSEELQIILDDYIDYYNYDRFHSALKYKTPYQIWSES